MLREGSRYRPGHFRVRIRDFAGAARQPSDQIPGASPERSIGCHYSPVRLMGQLAIRPVAQEAGFGYVRCNDRIGNGGFRLDACVKKPGRATAESYLKTYSYDWSSSILVFQAGGLLD